jgi:hypothetical protein
VASPSRSLQLFLTTATGEIPLAELEEIAGGLLVTDSPPAADSVSAIDAVELAVAGMPVLVDAESTVAGRLTVYDAEPSTVVCQGDEAPRRCRRFDRSTLLRGPETGGPETGGPESGPWSVIVVGAELGQQIWAIGGVDTTGTIDIDRSHEVPIEVVVHPPVAEGLPPLYEAVATEEVEAICAGEPLVDGGRCWSLAQDG